MDFDSLPTIQVIGGLDVEPLPFSSCSTGFPFRGWTDALLNDDQALMNT